MSKPEDKGPKTKPSKKGVAESWGGQGPSRALRCRILFGVLAVLDGLADNIAMTHPREFLKQLLPAPVRRTMRFIYRLPVYYRADLSYQVCAERDYGHATVALSKEVQIVLPDHAVANSVFRAMAFESQGRKESTSFLALAQGCRRLVDLGASGGFFSALFARSRSQGEILSVEFDKASLEVLEQTKSRNQDSTARWVIDRRGVGETPGTVELMSSGYGGVVSSEADEIEAKAYANMNRRTFERYEARIDCLATICQSNDFIPDILKVDIEGFEYEMVRSSMDFLGDVKPRLSLELHVRKLQAQKKNPEDVLVALASLGYKLTESGAPLTEMLKHIEDDGNARATMAVGVFN